MSKCITILCLFLVIACGGLHGQNVADNHIDANEYVTFSDTGYIIYTEPHFTGLFVSTRDSSLINALATNPYLSFFMTYHEDFKNFIVKNDSPPAFIKNNKDIDLYNFGAPDQITINYFRVVIKIKEPRSSFQRIEGGKDVKTAYYMRNRQTDKITYLHGYINSDWSVLHCEDYRLL